MDPVYKEFLWLQWPMITTIAGMVFALLGDLSGRNQFLRWGLIIFLLTGISALPLYYAGLEAVEWMQQTQLAGAEEIKEHRMDGYATVIANFFLSITALMSLLMLRSLKKVPRLFLYPILLYALLLIGFIGWRQMQMI